MTVDSRPEATIQEQARALLAHVAGYVGHRTIALGLRQGLIAALAASQVPLTPDELAQHLGLDPFYVAVWCQSAFAAGVCDAVELPRDAGSRGPGGEPQGARGAEADGWRGAPELARSYGLAPHVATLLLDATFPGYFGGVYTVLEQREVFERFESVLGTGERLWWDECSPEWIDGVASTGMPFYRRLAPAGLAEVPGLASRLDAGCRILDAACGSGAGLVHLAATYPGCTLVGVDGDAYSSERARAAVAATGLAQRVTVLRSPLEELAVDEPVTLAVNNISMHECRDIDEATRSIRAVLEPGGWFVISDFPFPDTASGLRSAVGRVMCGIQFFEAQIGDQLLPRTAYDDLLDRHGFEDIGHVDISPMHALTYGRTPAPAAP